MAEKEIKYTIAECGELPSKGLIYGKRINPYIEVRSFTARDEMKRVAPTNTPFKTLAEILEGCLLEKPEVHVYDMCIGDFEYILHRARITSYGPEFNTSVQCPYCGEYVEGVADLDALEVKQFDLGEFEDTRTFTLPVSNKTISLKFQTPRIIDEIELKAKELKRKYKDAEVDFSILSKLMLTIDTVDGAKLSPVDLEVFINKLPAKDMLKITNAIDKLNSMIGIDSSLYITCPRCGESVLTFFRFGTEFFRPSNI